MLQFSSPAIPGSSWTFPKSSDLWTLLTTKNTHTLRKIKILQIDLYFQSVIYFKLRNFIFCKVNPSRGRLYGESPMTCPRFICESRHIISTLWWLDSRVDLPGWWLFDHGDSRVKSRVESPVNRVVSRPATCHNVIAGLDKPDSWTCWKPVFRLRRQRFTATQ